MCERTLRAKREQHERRGRRALTEIANCRHRQRPAVDPRRSVARVGALCTVLPAQLCVSTSMRVNPGIVHECRGCGQVTSAVATRWCPPT